MHKEMLMLKHSLLTIVSGVYDLWACSAQLGLLGICLAAAWNVTPLITSAAKRSLRVLIDSDSPGIHFGVSAAKSSGQSALP
jgi:hypothetical protein